MHTLETKYELLKVKMQDVTTNMAAQVAYTIDELREQLAQTRHMMSQMAEEHQHSMDDAKRIFAKVSRKMAESLDEVTQERDNFEDQVDQLKQRLRSNEDRLQRVFREKKEDVNVLKGDFSQVLDIAKQEVQRKYGFELKQLKRCVIHLKNKLIEEIDQKQRLLNQLQQCHSQELAHVQLDAQKQIQSYIGLSHGNDIGGQSAGSSSLLQVQPTSVAQ